MLDGLSFHLPYKIFHRIRAAILSMFGDYLQTYRGNTPNLMRTFLEVRLLNVFMF